MDVDEQGDGGVQEENLEKVCNFPHFSTHYRVDAIGVETEFGNWHLGTVGTDINGEATVEGVEQGVHNVQREDQPHGQCVLVQLVVSTKTVSRRVIAGKKCNII